MKQKKFDDSIYEIKIKQNDRSNSLAISAKIKDSNDNDFLIELPKNKAKQLMSNYFG